MTCLVSWRHLTPASGCSGVEQPDALHESDTSSSRAWGSAAR
ncbi:hypothetical protein GFS60_04476 [Rhodococcus sp. WAY2]|nr:hypothetical protein GFS60_04476 [Rhodococcus sp. WAY2]